MTECSDLLSDCKSAISALILQGNAFTEIFSWCLKYELKFCCPRKPEASQA